MKLNGPFREEPLAEDVIAVVDAEGGVFCHFVIPDAQAPRAVVQRINL